MIEQLRELYRRSNAVRTPEEDIALFMANPDGYVIRTPQYVVLAKEIVHWMSEEELRDPAVPLPKGISPEGYYIYAHVGDFTNFLQFMPHPLPWVAWHRREVLRFYSLPQIRRKISGLQIRGGFNSFLVKSISPLANSASVS